MLGAGKDIGAGSVGLEIAARVPRSRMRDMIAVDGLVVVVVVVVVVVAAAAAVAVAVAVAGLDTEVDPNAETAAVAEFVVVVGDVAGISVAAVQENSLDRLGSLRMMSLDLQQ